jgi:hypothetical protein
MLIESTSEKRATVRQNRAVLDLSSAIIEQPTAEVVLHNLLGRGGRITYLHGGSHNC